MVDYTQILLFAVVISLTVLTIFIGIKIYQVLDDVHKVLKKTNNMMDNAQNLTNNIGRSVKSITGFGEGLRTIFGLIRLVSREDKRPLE